MRSAGLRGILVWPVLLFAGCDSAPVPGTAAGSLASSRTGPAGESPVPGTGLQGEIDRVEGALAAAKTSVDFGQTAQIYLGAMDSILRISERHKDPKIQAEFRIQEFAARVTAERRRFFEERMPAEVYRWLRKTAEEKAAEPRVKDLPNPAPKAELAILQARGTFAGARRYFTRQVTEDLLEHLLRLAGPPGQGEELQKILEKDTSRLTDADKDRAKRLAFLEITLRSELKDKFWRDRSRTGGCTTSYGQGSFIVVKSDLRLTRRQNAPDKGEGPPAVDLIKTPDQWWEQSSVSARADWLLSWYADRGAFLEVIRSGVENQVPCDDCGGLGYKETDVASNSEAEPVRCPSCNGCKVVQKVRWR